MQGKDVANVTVGILMGSASDAEVMLKAKEVLDEFGVASEVRAISAHRTPKIVCDWAENAEGRGVKVIIAAAGMAAHLAGIVAAHTQLPVIGVPLAGGLVGGLDALLSTVQMPKGTPVATVSVGAHGAINAALLAVKILSLGDAELRKKLTSYYRKQVEEVLLRDNELSLQVAPQ